MRVSLIHQNAKVPTRATPDSVGCDLYAVEETILGAGMVTPVHTGVVLEIDLGLIGSIRPRSGLSKRGLIGILGTIDPDYRGELIVLIHNTTLASHVVHPGDRIAQITFEATLRNFQFVEVPVGSLSKTDRGTDGFGSSGR